MSLNTKKPFIFTFSSSTSTKSHIACLQCKKAHRKCVFDGEYNCDRCNRLNIVCSLQSQPKYVKAIDLFSSETVYANVLQQNSRRSQYITTTQPLAPILSKDSALCLDGEILGLYSPWRDAHYDKQTLSQSSFESSTIDPDLKIFLKKKDAFYLPKKSAQLKLLRLFFENVYPLYPVIDKNIKLEDIPLLLLNAIMLSAIRYSDDIDPSDIRVKADELLTRCKYLEMLENDKLTIVQSYLLMSTHEEGTYGSSSVKEYCSKACIICVQLGLHILSEANLEIETIGKDIEISKLKYERSLLLRIFWTTFCCDRYMSVTSSSAMFYNISDLLIEKPTLKDFNDSESDFLIFNNWLSLCNLLDRILCMTYKPPGKRSQDDSLEMDLLNWETNNDIGNLNVGVKFKSFLSLAYCFCNILFLRCRIGVFNLIESTDILDTLNPIIEDNESSTPLSFSGMKYVHVFSARILSILKDESFIRIEHILNTHSLLHALVFIHLEVKVKYDDTLRNEELSKMLRFKADQLKEGVMLLKNFKTKWWLSGAAYELFNVILADYNCFNDVDESGDVYTNLITSS